MSSRTDIVNLALLDVGVKPSVASWDEDSTEAEYARAAWDQAVAEALTAHSWLFATKQVQLQRSGTEPVARYEYAYELPGDYVRLGAIADSDRMYPPLRDYRPFSVDGRLMIAASAEYVFIEYVYNAPNIGYWPPHFVKFLSAVLAVPLSNSLKTIRQDLDKLVTQRLAHAKSIDSLQLPPREPPMTGWQRAMRGERR
jgi:hypothetical protein